MPTDQTSSLRAPRDRWVNAVFELVVPLEDVDPDASNVDKQLAAGEALVRLLQSLPGGGQDIAASGRWEDATGDVSRLQWLLHEAYTSMSRAWSAIQVAQDEMRDAGVPDLIVDHLEASRLACVPPADFAEVVTSLTQFETAVAAALEGGGDRG